MTFARTDFHPVSQRVRTRLPNLRCGFCGNREGEEGRVITVQPPQRAICEPCIELADEMAECSRLARRPAKATRVRK